MFINILAKVKCNKCKWKGRLSDCILILTRVVIYKCPVCSTELKMIDPKEGQKNV